MSEKLKLDLIPLLLLIAGLFAVYLIFSFIYSKVRGNKSPRSEKQNDENVIPQPLTSHAEDPTKPKMTLNQLSQHDGAQKPTIYVSIMNAIFDVTDSEKFRPGGTYAKFAGKECSVALAKMSFEDKYLNCFEEHRAALGDSDSLKGWLDFMKKKYTLVGYVYSPKKDN